MVRSAPYVGSTTIDRQCTSGDSAALGRWSVSTLLLSEEKSAALTGGGRQRDLSAFRDKRFLGRTTHDARRC
jgi:hypothetical protein